MFGSRCWYTISKEKLKKLDARAGEAILLGYAKSKKAYKLWDMSENKVVLYREVTFDETYAVGKTSPISLDEDRKVSFKEIDELIDDSSLCDSSPDSQNHPPCNTGHLQTNESPSDDDTSNDNQVHLNQTDGELDTVDLSTDASLQPSDSILNAPRKPRRASTRSRRAPGEW